jgi:sulfur transfer complex TusBCD TusB component (DsrH family)
MAKKILQVVQSAYRATIEEQDDTVVWLTHAMKGAGGQLDLLLCGNAVNYAVKGQDASGLTFGSRRQTQPAPLADDVAKLVEKGSTVFLLEEDLALRGIEGAEIIPGLKRVSRSGVAKLFESYDQVWSW